MTSRRVSATRDPQAEIAQPRRSRKAAQKAARPEWTATVWKLRRQGLGFQAIEDLTREAGDCISRATACRLYHAELTRFAAETKTDVDTLRAQQGGRIEHAISVLVPQMQAGDTRAASALAKFTDQYAKLFGLYAPLKVDLKDERFRALTDDALHTELQRGASALGYTLVPAG